MMSWTKMIKKMMKKIKMKTRTEKHLKIVLLLTVITLAALFLASCEPGGTTRPPPAFTPVTPASSPSPAPLQPAKTSRTVEGLPARAINPKDGAVMILIPPGKFIMGSDPGEPGAKADESPRRKVYLGAYYVYEKEVTNGMFLRFIEETGYSPAGRWDRDSGKKYPDHPAVYVTYVDAEAYCRWAEVTLPTEAQWERAARGTDGSKYPWGNRWDSNKCNNAGTKDPELLSKMAPIVEGRGTIPGGAAPGDRSPEGVMDLAGNVNEWCLDYWSADYYKNAPSRNPAGPSSGVERVLRGGSWSLPPSRCRCASRWSGDVDSPLDDYGFRCTAGVNTVKLMLKASREKGL